MAPLYEVLQKHGYSEEEAYRAVSEEMWKFLDPSTSVRGACGTCALRCARDTPTTKT